MYRSRIRHSSARSPRTAFSMLGLLITLVCMVILFAIGMSALNKAVTGEGSVMKGTVRSTQDQVYFYELQQSMYVAANDFGARFLTPSELNTAARGSQADDTTASLFSAMLMNRYTTPSHLISANEYSPYVEADENYDWNAYDPRSDVYWDPDFAADLRQYSNVSFAHLPLYGKRFDEHWKPFSGAEFPILGNRGPKDGIDDPNSETYGRNRQWAGHLVFGDGSIKFVQSFTPPGASFMRNGQTRPDNIFAVEDGPNGRDAILSFTEEMTADGPKLQWD